MKELMRILMQALGAGLLFMLLVPLVAVYVLGEPGSLAPDEASFEGKIKPPDTIDVWLEDKGKTVEVDFEDYVCRVAASEMPHTFDEEALKAQSVAARTYAMAKIEKFEETKPASHPDAPVCSTTHCQVYKTEKQLIESHESGWEKNGWEKIQKACHATEGELLYYDGELVMQPLFFSSSGGQTENSEDVFVGAYPYLVSVSSPYEEEATHQDEETRMGIKDFAEKIRAACADREIGSVDQSTIKILSRTSGGRVAEMRVGDGAGGTLKGTEVRTALGLSSALFTIRFEDGDIIFTSSGSGHGVGLSQYGADGMAREGYSYKEILQHYYSGTEVY